MPKWEYRILDSQDVEGEGLFGEKRSKKDIEEYLNKLGRQGWEVVSMDVSEAEERINFVGVAKRELLR